MPQVKPFVCPDLQSTGPGPRCQAQALYCKPYTAEKNNVEAVITEDGTLYSRVTPCEDGEVPTVTICGYDRRNLEEYCIGCAEEMNLAQKLAISHIDERFNINIGFDCMELSSFTSLSISHVTGQQEVIEQLLLRWFICNKRLESLRLFKCDLSYSTRDTIRSIIDEGNWRFIDVASCNLRFPAKFIQQVIEWWEEDRSDPVSRELRFTTSNTKDFKKLKLSKCSGRSDRYFIQMGSRRMNFTVEPFTRKVVVTFH